MILKLFERVGNTAIQKRVVRVVRVYNRNIPSGITVSAFTAKGELLVGTGTATYTAKTPGADGTYLKYDSTDPTGMNADIPSVSVQDTTNFLINGGFDLAQRQAPGTLTAVADNAYGADRWKCTRENADLQYQRNDANAESGLTSRYYGKFKKITNNGKFMILQILEGAHTLPLRSKTVIFQAKMKASSAKTIRMAILELQTAGTMDTIPNPIATAFNVDSTDPTLGTNIAVVTGAESKSVTTTWTTFSVSVTVPSDSKNLICALWTDADFTAGDELNIAEAGLYLGSSTRSWTGRNMGDVINMCRRYYWNTFAKDVAPAQNAGLVGALRFIAGRAGANGNLVYVRFPVAMRVVPTTTTTYNPSAANAQVRDTSAGADCTSTTVSAATLSEDSALITATGAVGTAVGNVLNLHFSADAEL